jgi:hypothetical protein
MHLPFTYAIKTIIADFTLYVKSMASFIGRKLTGLTT